MTLLAPAALFAASLTAFAAPAQPAPRAHPPPAVAALFAPVSPVFETGLSAPDVGPLVQGVIAEGVHTLVFAGCFLALDDGQTCVEIAGHARDDIARR